MIKTLRESKAKLSELVETASRGEDVLITVRGKVKARLTRAAAVPRSVDGVLWTRQLRKLHRRYTTRQRLVSVEQILSETRADRV